MRVCLDAGLGAPWTKKVARPAVQHMTDLQFADVIGVAETIIAEPETLVILNEESLFARRKARRVRPTTV